MGASWTIGSVTVTKVVELEQVIPLSGLLPDAVPSALDAHRSWLEPEFIDGDGRARLSIHALIVEHDGLRLLVDTCIGDREVAGIPGLRGAADFPSKLGSAGFPVESIDLVCCTHLHFDHVGWNTRWDGHRWVPTFPRARYLFARSEYEHWMAEPGGYASNLPDTVAPVVEAGLADLVGSDHRITDAIALIPSPGHSPGHVSVRIDSEGQRALITGDATHHPVQWAEPEWGMSGDWDGEMGAATRRRLRERAVEEHMLVIGTHYPGPTAGRVVVDDGHWRFVTEGH